MLKNYSTFKLSNGVQFTVAHNATEDGPVNSINAAFDCWIAQTADYTCRSFVDYVNSKGFHNAVEVLHPGDPNLKLTEYNGSQLIKLGVRIGASESVKDSYWSAYRLGDGYYISLNDSPNSVWIANEETVNLYLEK